MDGNFDITSIPDEFKKWKNLSEYNKDWLFVSPKPRYRIAEHSAALDYLFSLYLWLKPKTVFDNFHKRLVLIIASSIYECVLCDALSKTAQFEISNSKIIKKFIKEEKIKNLDKKFEEIINNADEAEIISVDWKEYLHHIREVRDWIHLSKERNEKLETWFEEQSIENLINKVSDFRYISEKYYDRINIPF